MSFCLWVAAEVMSFVGGLLNLPMIPWVFVWIMLAYLGVITWWLARK